MTGKHFDILRLNPQDKPVYFIVEAFNPEDQETTAYYYADGACPTNYISRVHAIIVDGDTDPHGLFDFIRTSGELDFLFYPHNAETEWAKVVPEAFERGTNEK
jgi:hypothetical protein